MHLCFVFGERPANVPVVGTFATHADFGGATSGATIRCRMTQDSKRLEALDKAHVWHPFTWQTEWERRTPLIIEAAEGCELIDVEGRRYLDGIGSLWVSVHGHRHPHIDDALKAQLGRVAHTTLLGQASRPSIELAAKLAAITPEGLTRTFYSDSGSTAVEIALKMTFQWQQQQGHRSRSRFAALREAYHGDTIGSVSVGGIDLFHEVYRPLLFDALHLDCPTFREDEAALSARAVAAIRAEGDKLAGLVVEPLVQGAAGMRMHSPGFLRPILEAAREVGALVIIDEVATGFGRTGTLFATEQLDFAPDFLCIGKGLTNGYLPLAATVTTEAVYEGFKAERGHTFFHGHTFTGNQLACVAALASLELFDRERTLERVHSHTEQIRGRLTDLQARFPEVHQIRQTGLMTGIELRQPDGTPYNPNSRIGDQVCMEIRKHGAVLRPLGDVVVMMPPPAMSEGQLDRLFAALTNAMRIVLHS